MNKLQAIEQLLSIYNIANAGGTLICNQGQALDGYSELANYRAILSGVKTSQFEGFPKIPRLFRDIIITEKIDGTNAQVHVLEDGRVLAASRRRYITPDNDNHGFAAWVDYHADELRLLGPGRHFGEWWGKGIQRGYGLSEKRFSLFNVSRWLLSADDCPDPEHEIEEAEKEAPSCCDIVPILYAGGFDEMMVEKTLYNLGKHGSRVAPGFMRPEGIVILHVPSNRLFKVTLENDDKPKGEHNDRHAK